MTRFSFLCLFYISTGTAQTIIVGVKGGLPLSQAFNAQENPNMLKALLDRIAVWLGLECQNAYRQ